MDRDRGRQAPHGTAAELDSGDAPFSEQAARDQRPSPCRCFPGEAREWIAGIFPPARAPLRGLGHPAGAAPGARYPGLGGRRCQGALRGLQCALPARGPAATAFLARSGRAQRRPHRKPATCRFRQRRDRRRHRLRRHGARAARAGPRGDPRQLRPPWRDVARERRGAGGGVECGAAARGRGAGGPARPDAATDRDLALHVRLPDSRDRKAAILAHGRAARHRARIDEVPGVRPHRSA